jgi:hypothetical protein
VKRPVWRYSQEATTTAPLEVVRAKLAGLGSAALLSVCAPRLGGREPAGWQQENFPPPEAVEDGFRRCWTARQGALLETASFLVKSTETGCLLRAEGKLKGWPLLWKVGLFGWRSEGLLQRFVDGL